MIGNKNMDVISDKTDVLKILPEAAADLCTALFRNSPAGDRHDRGQDREVDAPVKAAMNRAEDGEARHQESWLFAKT